MTLTPAYGREYKSKKEVEAALSEGKDFILQPEGQYINYEQLPSGFHQVRYKRLTQVYGFKKS